MRSCSIGFVRLAFDGMQAVIPRAATSRNSINQFSFNYLYLSQIKSEYIGDAGRQDWKAKNKPYSLSRA
jgi:hypothetical protein